MVAGVLVSAPVFADDAAPALENKAPDASATVNAVVQPTGDEAAEVTPGNTVPQPRPTVMEFDVNAAGNVTLDFREADIKNVLKVLAYKSGVNIISGPEVVGLVNIQLKNVPWQKALEVILSTYGYSYEQKGTVIMVTTVDNLKKRREDAKVLADQELLSTETFLLNFSKAEDIVKTLDKMKTPRGSINFDQRTNSVIVTDIQSNIALFREVMKKLDAVTPQVLIEARIIETQLNNQEILGIKWPVTLGGTATMATRDTSFPWKTQRDSTFLPATTPAAAATLTYGTISFSDLAATLDMLQTRSNTNVLSNPRIVTLDNQPAKINVGSKYPLPKYTYSDTQDKLIISGWEYIEYGLTFNVTPHVNGQGAVSMDIEPIIMDSSTSVKFAFGGGDTTDVPILSTESAKTSVMIKDGETLVIAGLIKDKKTKIVDKVPFLGSIPILGLLFTHKNDTVVKTELVIFLTPHIITFSPDKPADKK
jgi:type IV pilus assembly protein PilQ